MFEADGDTPTSGCQILMDSLALSISILQTSPKRNPRILVGQGDMFHPGSFEADWGHPLLPEGEGSRVSLLRRLLRQNGHPPPISMTSQELLVLIRGSYDRILLPYDMNF